MADDRGEDGPTPDFRDLPAHKPLAPPKKRSDADTAWMQVPLLIASIALVVGLAGLLL